MVTLRTLTKCRWSTKHLLDHEYTPRALGWTRLKGADTGRAGTAGRKFDIQELIDSEVTLTHWTGPDGRRLEQASLPVSDGEVCASTEHGDLVPYSAEYEGYMGNWGNTLDRWYHRAAVVVWPRAQAFANRAETSPAWALDELAAMAAAGDVTGAREAAATLGPFWDGAVRGLTSAENGPVSELAGQALRTAAAIGDPHDQDRRAVHRRPRRARCRRGGSRMARREVEPPPLSTLSERVNVYQAPAAKSRVTPSRLAVSRTRTAWSKLAVSTQLPPDPSE